MGIKRLKKENEFLNMSIGDMLAKFDTSKTKKYSQFLVKMFNERIEEWNKNNLPELETSRRDSIEKAIPNNSLENNLVRSLICDSLFSWGNMERFVEFTELMEKGLVKENDISKYNSWEMLEIQLFEAKNREMFKKSKKEIHKIFEDENYMIFKPLTYLSSCSYGYQTKWCTAMINEPNYFYNHSKGVLIYLIDKKENKKFAFYKSVPEPYDMDSEFSNENYVFKTYNQEDKQIDTIQTGLPMNILQIIMMECDTKSPTTVPNYKLFSDDEKNIMREHVGKLPDEYEVPRIRMGDGDVIMEETDEMEEPTAIFTVERRAPVLNLQPRTVRRIQESPPQPHEYVISELTEELTRRINDLRNDSHNDLP